jgi:prophage regulatory protein
MLFTEAELPMTTPRESPKRDRLLPRIEVQSRTSLSRSTIYQLMSDGDFPKAIRIGVRRVAWWETEIDGWVQQRIKQARGGGM